MVRPLLRNMSRRRCCSFDATLRFEWLTRSLIGQPLSLRAWERMTLNDKVTYRRLRVRDPSFEVFSDRLAMREFVADRLGQMLFPSCWRSRIGPAAFAQRVGPFVIKANHGSGMVNLVQPGERLSSAELARADEWLVIDYAWDDLEWGYLDARRLLLAEEFLWSRRRAAAGLQVLRLRRPGRGARGAHRQIRRPASDRDATAGLEPLELPGPPPEQEADAPVNLDVMLDWAALLGRDLDFVRVDLYDLGDRVLVGELTAYPAGETRRTTR